MESFYVTLPSNSSMDIFPENTVSRFKTQLPTTLTFDQPYEMGLTEFIFPANWYNIIEGNNNVNFKRKRGWIRVPSKKIQISVQKGFLNITSFLQEMEDQLFRVVNTQNTDVFSIRQDQKVLIQIPPQIKQMELNESLAHALGFQSTIINRSTTGHRAPQRSFMGNKQYIFTVETNEEDILLNEDINQNFSIPEGHYSDPHKLLNLLNTLMVSILRLPVLKKDEGFTLDSEGEFIEAKLPFTGIEISMDPALASLFGFEKSTLSSGRRIKASFPFDVRNSYYSVYIYTDVIKPQLVGDSRSKLLQVLPAPQRTNAIISHTFNPIEYVPLEQLQFNQIAIDIRNGSGDLIPFRSGHSIVKLHFRPIKK